MRVYCPLEDFNTEEILHLWLNKSLPDEDAICVQYRIADGTLQEGTLVQPHKPVNSTDNWVDMGVVLDKDRDFIQSFDPHWIQHLLQIYEEMEREDMEDRFPSTANGESGQW